MPQKLNHATTQVRRVAILCPECQEPVQEPNGADPGTVREFNEAEYLAFFNRDDGEQPMCSNCGAEFLVPQRSPFFISSSPFPVKLARH